MGEAEIYGGDNRYDHADTKLHMRPGHEERGPHTYCTHPSTRILAYRAAAVADYFLQKVLTDDLAETRNVASWASSAGVHPFSLSAFL